MKSQSANPGLPYNDGWAPFWCDVDRVPMGLIRMKRELKMAQRLGERSARTTSSSILAFTINICRRGVAWRPVISVGSILQPKCLQMPHQIPN